MKQNKIHLSLLAGSISILLFSGCTPDERGLWKRHEQATQEKNALKARIPAQSAPKCFADRYNDTLIRQDVQKMESEYAGGKHGSYQHGEMIFPDLPQATIDLLKKNYNLQINVSESKTWTATDPKQKDCKDYSCFIDALYAKPSDEGLLHYWFFLKTGYPFAALNYYPWQNDQGIPSMRTVENLPVEKYLLDKREWQAMWKVTHMLPKSMLFLPSLTQIHRTPHDNTPQEWKERSVAAWAVGYSGAGHILYSDSCFDFNEGGVFETSSYFYPCTTHEIAHRLSSWNFGAKGEKSTDVEPEFLAFSGWHFERLPQADGTVKEAWKSSGDTKGWPSSYAKTSPAEDFAEMVGIFRSTPMTLKVRAPEKYDYAKRKVFANRGYALEDLKVQYANDVKEGLIERVEEWVNPCLTGKENANPLSKAKLALAKMIQINLPVDSKIKTCVQSQVLSAIEAELDQIRYNEPEGCLTLDNFESEITKSAITRLVPDLNEYFRTYEKMTDLMTGVQGFRTAVSQEFDGRSLVLACWQDKTPEECYRSKLDSEYDRLYLKFKVLLSVSQANIADIEKTRFMAANAYDAVYAKVVQFYDGIFSKYADDMKDRSSQIWEACLTVPSRANTDVLLEPYAAGERYVAPAIIQCLNEKIPDQLTAIRAQAGQDQGVNFLSAESKVWINQRILWPRFKTLLDGRVTDASRADEAMLKDLKAPAVTEAFTQLTRDSAWRKSSAYSYVACKATASLVVREKLKADSYRFFAIDPVVETLANETCEKVRVWLNDQANQAARPQNPSVRSTPVQPDTPPVPTDAQKKEIDSLWSKYQSLFVDESSARFERCRGRAYFAQRLKRFCLFTEWVVDDQDQYRKTAFSWTVDRAARKWLADAEVKAFLSAKGYTDVQLLEVIRARADDERQELGDLVMTRFYSQN